MQFNHLRQTRQKQTRNKVDFQETGMATKGVWYTRGKDAYLTNFFWHYFLLKGVLFWIDDAIHGCRIGWQTDKKPTSNKTSAHRSKTKEKTKLFGPTLSQKNQGRRFSSSCLWSEVRNLHPHRSLMSHLAAQQKKVLLFLVCRNISVAATATVCVAYSCSRHMVLHSAVFFLCPISSPSPCILQPQLSFASPVLCRTHGVLAICYPLLYSNAVSLFACCVWTSSMYVYIGVSMYLVVYC